MPACLYSDLFGARIAIHSLDAPELRECAADLVWTDDFEPSQDLRFIHTPGDTPGSASLLLSHGDRRILFCGDFLGLDASGNIFNWGETIGPQNVAEKLLDLEFDAIASLHTQKGCPYPFLLKDCVPALRRAILSGDRI